MEYKNAEHSMGSKELACYIINAMNKREQPINETKIQKLTYLVYGFYLGLTGECIINDEKPKARPYGPVFPKVSKIFKKIRYDMSDFDNYELDNIEDSILKQLIGIILDKFGDLSASQLVDFTHMDDTPRTKTKEQENFIWNRVIDDGLTYEYFRK